VTKSEKDLANAILRQDFPIFLRRCFQTLNPASTFLPNWHLELLCHHAQLVKEGKVRRLMINLPPRYLKSLTFSVALPAFLLGHNPARKIIVVSHGADLATKLADDFRTIIRSGWFKSAFPGVRMSKNTDTEVATTKGGFRLATSVDGSLTGRGGDVIIIDDPLKSADASSAAKRTHVNKVYKDTVLTRLDDKANGVIIIVMQRLHVADLCGDVLNGPEEWVHLRLPAIAQHEERFEFGGRAYVRRAGEPLHPEREPIASLESTRAQLGPDIFAAQYLQNPNAPEGNMVKKEWVRRYDALPARTPSTYVIQSWDTASTASKESSYSVCTTWFVIEKRYYLTDVLRGRFDYPALRDQALAHSKQWQPTKILIEDAGVGPALAAELSTRGFAAERIRVEHNKATRMSVQTGKFASGHIYFPKQACWLADLEAELFSFPGSNYDDQIDSISQALSVPIHASMYTTEALEGMSRLTEALAADAAFGRLAGRPW
jgi:predicted phage terminase large subunit-like protein